METSVQFCFTCLSTDRELIKYENLDKNISNFYERFVADDTDMNNSVQNLNYLCQNCCMQLKNSYCFWKQCMHSKSRLENYISELENQNRNYFNMQHATRNNDVVKTEDDDNIVLMELGNMNTSNMHHSNNHNESYSMYHNFRRNEDTKGNELDELDHFAIKMEKEDTNDIDEEMERNTNFLNMDFNIKSEEMSSPKSEKESKELYKPFQCNICQHKFVNKGNLKRHILLIHADASTSKLNTTENSENSSYQCSYCPKKLLTKNNLMRHMQKHTGELAFHCKMCSKSFSNKTMCSRHEETHARVMIYECDICKTEYTNLEEFKTHRNSHESQSEYKCKNCNKMFETEEDLGKHKEDTCEKHIETNFQCKNCDKKFKTNLKLQRHMLTHSDEKTFNCTYADCDKSFPDKVSLKEHAKTHTGKNLECQTCFKKFGSVAKLKDHQNSHLGIKPYECMICAKYFSHASSLDTHLKSHTNEDKPFKCGNCEKSYLSKSALKLHESIHKNESYSCSDCNLEFNSRSSLYRHIKSHKLDKSSNSDIVS